jgi:hypothetical protein
MSGELLPPPTGSSDLNTFVGSVPIPPPFGVEDITQANVDSAVAFAVNQLPRAPILVPTTVHTSAYSAQAGDLALLSATSGSITQPLPVASGSTVFAAKKIDPSGNTVVLTPSGTNTIDGLTTPVTLSLPNETRTFLSAPGGWITTSGINPLLAASLPFVRTVNGVAPSVAGDVTVPVAAPATTTSQGLVRLTGDFGGTADFPTVPALSSKADLVSGKIPTSQIPALALVTSVPVADQAAMLALTATQVQPGDLALRADGAGTFILMAADPSVLANWTLLPSPTDQVTSVNGQKGTVVLAAGDIGAATTSALQSEVARATSAEQANNAFLAGKADLVGGVVSLSQVPPIALTTSVPVSSQAAMLALTSTQVQPGDFALRSDGAGTFILSGSDPSLLSNWSALPVPLQTPPTGGLGLLTPRINDYCSPHSTQYSVQPTNLVVGRVAFSPFFFPGGITVNSITIYINVAGAAGSTVRMSLWTSAPGGHPSALILDGGTVPATTAGYVTLAIPPTFLQGLVWAGTTSTVALSIYGTVCGIMQSSHAALINAASNMGMFSNENTYTGVMPTALTTPASVFAGDVYATPYLQLRRSA